MVPNHEKMLYYTIKRIRHKKPIHRNLVKHQAKKQQEWMFKKTRDFNNNTWDNNYTLMKLKQRKRF